VPSVFQPLDSLRNKLDCTLWHLRQQLRPSLRTSEIRLRRTVRTDFPLRVPACECLAAVRRNIDKDHSKSEETGHAGTFHKATEVKFDYGARTFVGGGRDVERSH